MEFQITNGDGVAATKTITIIREPLPYEIISPLATQNSKKEDQVNVNSNFVDIVLRAEGADSVLFGKTAAVRSTKDTDVFTYTAEALKKGANSLKFTVTRGTAKLTGTLIVYNSDTAIVGAQYQTKLAAKMSAFGGKVELSFPKETQLMRTKPFLSNSFLTKDRQILFGIADSTDGRVDKINHPIPSDTSDSYITPFYIEPILTGKNMLMEQTGRFRPASERFWIDGGVMNTTSITAISKDKQQEFLNGRGLDPYGSPVASGTWNPYEIFYNRVNAAAEVIPTLSGTLKLKYDADIRNDSWRYLTVVHFEYFTDYRGVPGYRWRNIGGVVDNNNKTISVPVSNFGYYQVMYMDKSFDDVISHPWAKNQLDTLYSKGIMNKKVSKSTTFDPYDPITRGEFVTLLVKIFQLKLDFEGKGTFTDVVVNQDNLSDGLYEYKYIETAARKGIVRGTAGGAFLPGLSITREDAASMIAKAANLKLSNVDSKTLTSLQKSFTDANLIQTYARSAVEAVVKAKLMKGMENALAAGSKLSYRYAPKDTFSRAEAAEVAINVMALNKMIPK
ncbi:MAG: S-layer homology domain-containing protein [Gorillibacterium sp.]|nr:S-layer homology domain-containing protein [Gorillibacterium sp.]